MMTEQYTKTLFNTRLAAEILNEAGSRMFKAQYREAVTYLVTRSGRIERSVSSPPPHPSVSSNSVSAVFSYPKHIRFLDLKRGSSKRKKKNYRPIYNKYVYGYMMGYAYRRLASGFAAYVRSTIYHELSSLDLNA